MGTKRFVLWGSAVTVVTGLAIFSLLTLMMGMTELRWGLLGWFLMASLGVVGGAWMTAVHGRPDAGFVLAVCACMLMRLVAAGSGAFAVSGAGDAAVRSYLAGLASGFVPVQAFEIVWFLRRERVVS